MRKSPNNKKDIILTSKGFDFPIRDQLYFMWNTIPHIPLFTEWHYVGLGRQKEIWTTSLIGCHHFKKMSLTSVDRITRLWQCENYSDAPVTSLPVGGQMQKLFKMSNGETSVPLFVLLFASLKINGGGHWMWCTGFQEKGAILPLLYPGAETSTWIWQHHLSKEVQE